MFACLLICCLNITDETFNETSREPTETSDIPLTTTFDGCDIIIDECISEKCTDPIENPNCADLRSWGCQICDDGYWKLSFEHPCISCVDTFEGCIDCDDFNGVVSVILQMDIKDIGTQLAVWDVVNKYSFTTFANIDFNYCFNK